MSITRFVEDVPLHCMTGVCLFGLASLMREANIVKDSYQQIRMSCRRKAIS